MLLSSSNSPILQQQDSPHNQPGQNSPETDPELEKSILLATQLQQEFDDQLIRNYMQSQQPNTRTGAISPSQYTYEDWISLCDNIGQVSRGANQKDINNLPIYSLTEFKTLTQQDWEALGTNAEKIGDTCTICMWVTWKIAIIMSLLPKPQ